ncbi:efflux RND transporter periplasmic adaptor subunit [Methylocapsa aurea]|uniref:efflux RND transporter periplasmic adaptor subunit n=1 Tax=Methylocapsa aurea TaxID=663610 RepID=UPI003D1880B1
MDEKVLSPITDAEAAPARAPMAARIAARLTQARRAPMTIGLSALIAAALAWAAYHAIAPTEPQAPRSTHKKGSPAAPQPVAVATIARRDIKIVRHGLLGTVTPIANVSVKSQISGYLMEVGYKEGQFVQKGDFLAQVDPRPYEAQKAQLEGQMMRDQGSLEQARDDMRRYQSLKKLDSISRQQADNQTWVVKQYEGAVKADQAQIDNQNLNLAYARIVAPVAGRVGLRKVDAGNYVTTADVIALVTQIDPITVIFGVPEDYIPDIMRAQKKSGGLEVAAFDRSDTKQIATGRLLTLDNSIDSTTGMVSGRAEFENKEETLYPNQFVNVHLLVDVREKTIAAPKAAIRTGASGPFVYKVTDDSRVVMQSVAPAEGEHFDDFAGFNDGMIEIASGLAEGDRVVVDGADRLRDGASVRLAASDGRASAAPPSETPRKDPSQEPPQERRRRRQTTPQ